jgi:hypothetical protein
MTLTSSCARFLPSRRGYSRVAVAGEMKTKTASSITSTRSGTIELRYFGSCAGICI